MNFLRTLAATFFIFLSISALSQKQLVILKNGHVQAAFKEGEYMRFVMKKNHRHTEGHIIELYDFYMITSSDTIQFKDILKVNIKKNRGPARWNKGLGGLLFVGGIIYLGVDQLNVAIGINSSSTPAELFTPMVISSVGAAMVFIRPKYKRLNGIQYLQTVDYRSPFYQSAN
ncbi:MAG: hypothetical protein HY015_02680 [Bacteroidetes bacterium]|nr:hypothetical protein [Bacteroidota bacterium]MBI3481875.1 hypothetical protein [Bacteroidota bacterium]